MQLKGIRRILDIYENKTKTMTTTNLAELVLWEQVRSDCKYPKEDNNNGYLYGLNLIDKDINDEDWSGDIIDVQWFKNDQERFDFVKENNLKIINN